MAYKTLEQGETIGIGEGEGERKSAGGLLVKIKKEVGKFKSNVYSFIQEDGEILKVWGSTTTDDKLDDIHIGKFVILRYLGMEKGGTAGREFEDIKVDVWNDDDPLSDRLLNWPFVEKYYDVKKELSSVSDDDDEDSLPF